MYTSETDLGIGYLVKNKTKMEELEGFGVGLNSNTLLIIKLPDSRVLRVISRSLFFAMVILTLPFIGSIISGSSSTLYDSDVGLDLIDFEFLPSALQNLIDDGLVKKGHKGLILSSGVGDIEQLSDLLEDNEIHLDVESDLHRESLIPNETFDFVLASSFQEAKFLERVIKISGIMVMQLSNNPSNEFRQQSNYKIVYIRRFRSTVIAMRKIGVVDGSVNSQAKRRLCGVMKEAKKVALEGLEDVLLEPPRRELVKKSSNGLRKIKFLPDLLIDSLESYQRRIFITDEKTGVLEWFHENYPNRNQKFEFYNLAIEMNDPQRVKKRSLSRMVPRTIGVSDWLMNNVREDDYVVMKAEAGVVEEMIEKKTICLVDEMFLECKNQWQDDGEENGRKRPYWQCLALYGRLRDEEIAVHQWWG